MKVVLLSRKKDDISPWLQKHWQDFILRQKLYSKAKSFQNISENILTKDYFKEKLENEAIRKSK